MLSKKSKDSKRGKTFRSRQGLSTRGWTGGLGLDLPIPPVHAQTFISESEVLHVLASSLLAPFPSLLSCFLGEAVPRRGR